MNRENGGIYRIVGVIPLVRGFFSRVRDDNVPAYAAQAAFFILLALVPFCALFLSLLSLTPFDERLLTDESLIGFLPSMMTELLLRAVPANGGFTAASLLTALWSSSRGMLSITRGLNHVCRCKETRNALLLRLISAACIVALLLALLVSIALVVLSDDTLAHLEANMAQMGVFPSLAVSFRYAFAFLLLFLVFAVMYALLPAKTEKLNTRFFGAAVASSGWIAFTRLFSLYVDMADGYSRLYGSLAAVAVTMLWLYFCMCIFFLGEELCEYIIERK